MPTMRFKSNDEKKVFYFDSSPAKSIGKTIGINSEHFALRNERQVLGRKIWDVFSIGLAETWPEGRPAPLRKFGTLEYQAPEWPGGPSKPWHSR